jgi:thiamine biosynthesis lipoprotein
MGTMVSLEIDHPIELPGLVACFDRYDETFSLYRPDSELSRVASGELALTDASAELRDAYSAAIDWRSVTSGAFTPNRPDGVVDLDGIVKALAIDEAGRLLGPSRWCLNVGGDVLVNGDGWTVGVVDPDDRGALLCSFRLESPRRAIATSGVSERGEHVWGRTADFAQVTVIADDIVTADVLATAILAGGAAFRDTASARRPVDLATVTRDGRIEMTPGARAALAS